MIIIYVVKLTDENIYVYNKKTKKLYTKEIKKNIIKENKIYDISKIIKQLRIIFFKTKGLLKPKVKVLISKHLSPAEKYLFKKTFSEIPNINYKLVTENKLLESKKEIIIWGDIIYLKKPIKITEEILKTLNRNIAIGISNTFDSIKNNFDYIYEYENSDKILFIRA